MDCCDVACLLAFGYIILIPAIIILVVIVVGYHFKHKQSVKTGESSTELIPPKEKVKITKNSRTNTKIGEYRKKTTKKGKKK